MPHITRSKHTGYAGLQQERGPLKRCCLESVANTDQILAGEKEAAGAATARITVLLTAEEIDAATKETAAYRPPGQ